MLCSFHIFICIGVDILWLRISYPAIWHLFVYIGEVYECNSCSFISLCSNSTKAFYFLLKFHVSLPFDSQHSTSLNPSHTQH